MKYAKLIDGQIVYAPRKLSVGKYVVYNPTPEMLIADGWKPVHIDQYPEEDLKPNWTFFCSLSLSPPGLF